MEDLVFVRSENILSFPIQNGIYIHNTENDTFFSLEEGVATYFWENFDGSKNVKDLILEMVARMKDVTYDDIKDDIFGFIEELKSEGLIVVDLDKSRA